MKQSIMLSIRGRQAYMDQEPDTIELVTEGTMEYVDGGWNICYEESELTGLAGVTTNFRVESGKVTLTRTGKLNSQMIFRDNIQPMIRNKHVLVLMASVTTGFTAKRSIEAIGYYGGDVAGVAAIYRAVDEVGGHPVRSVYNISDIPDYESYDYRDCPYCKKGRKLDALVNSFGYSPL